MHMSPTLAAQCVAAVFSAVAFLNTAFAAELRPCELLSASQIASLSGVSPKPAQPSGPSSHPQEGATSWTCIWPAGEVVLVVEVHRFRSVVDAGRAMSEVKEISNELPDDVIFSSVTGVGEQAFWGTSPDIAAWIARRGKSVAAVLLGGEGKPLQAQRERLRGLVTDVLGKLP